MLLFKIIGLILVFSGSTGLGFLKSALLCKRADKLLKFSRGTSSLAERIRLCSGEIESLLNSCFPSEYISYTLGKAKIDESYLKRDDISIINELLSDLGMGDIDAEYERTKAYADLIKLQHSSAQNDCGQFCRLYKSLGALVGIFICIFLL